jgi:hypothetical protein
MRIDGKIYEPWHRALPQASTTVLLLMPRVLDSQALKRRIWRDTAPVQPRHGRMRQHKDSD